MEGDKPNFYTWSNKGLADFATEAYIRMREQQEAIEQYQRDLKDAMQQLRKSMMEQSNDNRN